MDYKDFLGVLAVALGAYSYVPYLYGMAKGTVTPHFFTWCIWALICGIGFAAQLHDMLAPDHGLWGLQQ